MKKILLSILCLSVVLAAFILLPTEASAATSGHYTYEISNGKATITDVDTSISGDITIPSTLGGYPVTTIGEDAFRVCHSLTSVTIGDSVTTVDNSAFYYCRSLTSVTIPNSVTTIGNSAFSSCHSLTSVTIGNGVTTIGEYAFSFCNSLTSITIPDSVTTIGSSAFNYCRSLTSITIPNSVTTIGDSAFYFCDSLTSVTIGDSVATIGDRAFYNCSSLTGIWVDEKNNHYSSDTYGVLFNKAKTTLIQAPGTIKLYTIPNTVTTISMNAFSACNSLEYNIYDNGRYLGDDQNQYRWLISSTSDAITSCKINSNTKKIACSAFSGCHNLTAVTIPNGVTTIGDSAFSCTGLKAVTIPNSVTSIGDYAFDTYSYSLHVAYTGNQSQWKNISIGSGNETLTNNADIHYKTVLQEVNTCMERSVYCPVCNTYIYRYQLSDGRLNLDTSKYQSSHNYGNNLTDGNNGQEIYVPGATQLIFTFDSMSCTEENFDYVIFMDCDGAYIHELSGDLANKVITIDIDRPSYPIYIFILSDESGTEYGYAFSSIVAVMGGQHKEVNVEGTAPTCTQVGLTDGTACEYCGEVFVPQTEIPMLEHSYGDWTVTQHPTLIATGERQKSCSACGDVVTEVIEMLDGGVAQWNVALADDLLVNFHLRISKGIESTAKVRIYVGENAYTFPVASLEKTEDGLYIAQVGVAAAQMNDNILVMVMNNGDIAHTAAYTIRQYADTILADENHSAYHPLVKEMLNYGAAAQVYFDYEAGKLANSGITGAGSVEIPDSVENEVSVSGSAEGISFYGASLIFRDRISVRYYFSFEGQINDLKFAANQQQIAPQLKDGLYYIEISDILPQDLDQPIILSVTDADDNVLSVSYSPMNYIVRMNETGSAELKALVKALYNYHLAAKALQI